jgi:hypothetical protein
LEFIFVFLLVTLAGYLVIGKLFAALHSTNTSMSPLKSSTPSHPSIAAAIGDSAGRHFILHNHPDRLPGGRRDGRTYARNFIKYVLFVPIPHLIAGPIMQKKVVIADYFSAIADPDLQRRIQGRHLQPGGLGRRFRLSAANLLRLLRLFATW